MTEPVRVRYRNAIQGVERRPLPLVDIPGSMSVYQLTVAVQALVTLLINKGVLTTDEWLEANASTAEAYKATYDTLYSETDPGGARR